MKAPMVVLLFATTMAYSQNDYVEYYSESYTLQKEKAGSYFSREVKKMGNKWQVNDFFTSDGSRKLEAECSEVKPYMVYNGFVKRYVSGGNPSSEEICRAGKCKYIQVWVNTMPILTNGNGDGEEINDKGARQVSKFRDSVMLYLFSIEPGRQDSIYLVTDKPAEYPGGMAKFYQVLQQKLEYPKSARKNREEGKVFVEFLVDKVGVVREVKVAQGVSPALDAEAVAKVPQAGSWVPGSVAGKPIKQRFVLPLNFTLKKSGFNPFYLWSLY